MTERGAALKLIHCAHLWLLNPRSCVRAAFLLAQSAPRQFGAVLPSHSAGKRQKMLSAERDAKKRADASTARDQGTSVVGKQIRAELQARFE